jgi:TatD DNase family protein
VTRPAQPHPLDEPVIDAHCHLDLPYGDEPVLELDVALDLARRAGVTRIVQTGFDLRSSHWAAQAADRHEGLIAAVALHPNEAPGIVARDGDSALAEALDEIDALAGLTQVRAVGETGMDFYRTGPEGREVQEHSFREHIRIAKRHNKALVIHDRDSHEDVIRILLDEGAPERVMFHSYSGDAAMARVCADHGWYLSFSGTVTYKNAPELREALMVTPQNRILVETDAPYLPPVPHRGQPNASYLVPLIVRFMAQVRQEPDQDLSVAIRENGFRLFGTW